MGIEKGTKLNQLLKVWPPGTVAVSSWLDTAKRLKIEITTGVIEFDGTFYRCTECDSKTVTGTNVIKARLD